MLIVTEWIREALRNPNSGINPFGGYTQGFKAGLFIKKMMQFRGQIGPPKRGFSAKNYFSPEKKNKYCPKCIKKDDDHQVKSMVNLVDDIAANALKSMVAGEELDTAAPLGQPSHNHNHKITNTIIITKAQSQTQEHKHKSTITSTRSQAHGCRRGA